MEYAALQGLLYVYNNNPVPYRDLLRAVGRHCSITGEDEAIVRGLLGKGYLLETEHGYVVSPTFDNFKMDFGISLSRLRGGRGLYVTPIFGGDSVVPERQLCFALMPFRPPFDSVFTDHIRKIGEEFKIECMRADDFFAPIPIVGDIWRSLLSAQIVIADLTGRNPNVFYEVGVAHVIGHDVILLTQSIDDVPFDLRHIRCIQYEYTPPGVSKLETQLRQALGEVLRRRPPNLRPAADT